MTTSAGQITPREAKVLSLYAQGYSLVDIGKELWISPKTVETHIRNACERLEARAWRHAAYLALMRGLIHLSEPREF